MAKLGYVFIWRQQDDSDSQIGILQSEGCSQIFAIKSRSAYYKILAFANNMAK
jgi:hypothetical protein